MTTSVHVAISGNKQVVVETQSGKTLMQPGSAHTFSVHGDGAISVREHGDFVSGPELPLVRPFVEEALEDGTDDFPLGQACDPKDPDCEACQ